MTEPKSAGTALYLDIPREYISGLTNGKLGDWLQEVHDAGWGVMIVSDGAAINHHNELRYFIGEDNDTHRVDIMLVRAYLAWRGREVSV